MNESWRLSDREVTDMLRRRSAHPAPDGLASAILESLASERAGHSARTASRSAKRPLMLLAAALLLGGGALAAGSGALGLWSITPPEPAPSLGPVDFPSLTATFVSPRNGFSVRYFDRGDGTVIPAKQLWGFSHEVDDGFDVVETGLRAVFKGASTNGGFEYFSNDYVVPGGCGVPRSQQAEITIDGQSGRISACPNRIEATVLDGGRLYLFTLTHTRTDARAVFDAFAATINLTPGTAVDFHGLTTTFVSPTNGFSSGITVRGGLTPATRLWDPVNNNKADDGFDVVETGLAAYFMAASTPIPDGVSIDEWVDEYVSPAGWLQHPGQCGGPRSQQEEIIIDGQSGRISECPDRIEATVVAGGRLYLFTLLHSRNDARAFFNAWIATVDLRPEAAAVSSISPSS